MNILFVVPYVPSLVRVRPYNLIRGLSARGHRVTVATIWTNQREREDARELEKHCTEVRAVYLSTWQSVTNALQAVATGEPLQVRYSWSTVLRDRGEALGPRMDVVHVEHLRGARYGLEARPDLAATATPVIWDSVDCISDLFEQAVRTRRDVVGRAINRFELSRTHRYEGWAVTQFDRVLVSSSTDGASLERLAKAPVDGRVSVLPNGVDLDYFAAGDGAREPDTVVFSGKMSYHANESAVLHLVRDIMPLVWAKRPGVRLVVVGKDPSKELLRLAAEHSPRVEVTGTVPDLRPHLRRATIAATPIDLRCVARQNKVLEAMACGTPVVATPRAVAAFRTQPGRDVVVAERPRAFAEAALALLEDTRRQQQIGQAGRAYVDAHHQWDRIAAELEAIYEGTVAERHAGPLRRAVRSPRQRRSRDPGARNAG